MNAKTLFKEAVTQAGQCLPHITSTDLSNATPCSEWDLKALLNHMVYELLWVPDVVSGKTLAEIGNVYDGDVLGDDFHAAWEKAVRTAFNAVDGANLTATAHLSYGDVTNEYYITEAAIDVLIHGWDVAQSIRCNMIMKPELAEAAYQATSPKKEGLKASGLFADPIKVADTATAQTKLLALVGRKAP